MYTLQLATEDKPREYAKFAVAKAAANKLAASNQVEIDVVDTETDNVVHVATYVEGRYFHPFERVETPEFAARHFEGFRAAYTRKRIGAVVYRALDHSVWRVLDTRSGKFLDVANTTVSRHLLTEMRLGRVL